MVTKNIIKYVHSLSIKKFRDEERCFVAEGPKVVMDLLPLLKCRTLYATGEFLRGIKPEWLKQVGQVEEISPKELERLSLLRSPRDVIAVFDFVETDDALSVLLNIPQHNLCLMLDGVQDPGNLGTIIRVADWFGIEHIFASRDTADVYSPKVVQATMGAIGRVQIHYSDLKGLLEEMPKEVPVFGTFLDGDDIYESKLANHGIIVMGNEGKGISDSVASLINRRLLIPNYPKGRPTSESLNVAIATAVVCAEFRKRM